MNGSIQADRYAIVSNQLDIHPNLRALVQRHLGHPFLRTVQREDQLISALAPLLADKAPIILDAGCGRGRSTWRLATIHDKAWVLGVDKSEARLVEARKLAAKVDAEVRDRMMFLHEDCVDLLVWAARQGMRFEKVYMLYPNPWPKKKHIQRRWPGHPVFPLLMQLTREVECRTNWLIYAKEFAISSEMCNFASEITQLNLDAEDAITHFEAKYLQCQTDIYQVLCKNIQIYNPT